MQAGDGSPDLVWLLNEAKVDGQRPYAAGERLPVEMAGRVAGGNTAREASWRHGFPTRLAHEALAIA